MRLNICTGTYRERNPFANGTDVGVQIRPPFPSEDICLASHQSFRLL